MRFRKRSSLAVGLCLLGFCVCLAATSAAAQPPARDQQIADLEKQIAELQKKLADLKAEPDGSLPAEWVKNFNWRSIGPASMGGRITALAVYENDPSTWWVATASGGLLKTTNNGVTFKHQFDRENTVSIGDVAVAPSDPNIVWVGTGENNPRNSVSFGDGVYKSTDGGDTWQHMGLKDSFQIGKIVIHPKDPNIVYVGALGRLYGPNPERGLFKTTDGGKTWNKIHYIDDKTGVIDVRMHPTDPETLIFATWERQRDEFDTWRGEPPVPEGYDAYDPVKKWGPGSGIYKTTDGGKTFKKLSKGLPSGQLGRVGLDWYRKDPNIVFAIVDCDQIGKGTPPPPAGYLGVQGEETPNGLRLTQVVAEGPAAKAGLKVGDVLQQVAGETVKITDELTDALRGKKAGDKVVLKVLRDGKTEEITATVADRPRGGPMGGPMAGQGFPPQFAGAMLLGAFGQNAEGGGINIIRITDGSAAAKAGLNIGDVLLSLDGQELASFNALTEALSGKKSGDRVVFKVRRGSLTADIPVILEERRSVVGTSSPLRPNGANYGGQAENVQRWQGENGHEYGGIYKSTDGGESWTRINSLNSRPMYFSLIRVDPSDDRYVYSGAVELHRSSDGGKRFTSDGGRGVHPDHHALWINPRDGRHMIVGCDGGVYVTYDRMANWDYLNHFAIGQFYHACVDTRRPYWVYGGLQDNGSWGGPSHVLRGPGILNEDWLFIAGGDGFVCRVDPNEPDWVYYESQDGGMGRRNIKTGQQAAIRPRGVPGQQGNQRNVLLSHLFANAANPFIAGNHVIPFVLSGRPPSSDAGYRFNWNTPFILSAHNPKIFYCAGNHVFRCLRQGDDLKQISPEITRTKRGTATALAESPRNSDVLWVGTDDGALWVTRDAGQTWKSVVPDISPGNSNGGLPGPRWVATIEPSRFVEGRCYVCFDGHRSDDDEPYLFVTEDFGATWKSIRANLPTGSTRCLREDISNPDLLFAGTEFALFASTNRGGKWTKINNNLPTVAVHEVAIHPTAGEIVAATHGRSLWVLDVTPLRQMTQSALKSAAKLYQPNTVTRWRNEPQRGTIYGVGARRFVGQNAPREAQIYYSLTKKAEKATLKIVDVNSRTVRELQAKTEPGLHLVAWDLTGTPDRSSGPPRAGGGSPRGEGGGPRGGGGGFFGGGRGGFASVPSGVYRVVLTIDGEEQAQTLRIEADPVLTERQIAEEEIIRDEEDR